MRKEAVIVALLILMSPIALVNSMYSIENTHNISTKVTTTTDINVYAEAANFYIGKAGHVAMVLLATGGHIEVPVDPSWPEFDGLVAMRIAGGIGHRWWLYYHHDICPEIPPTITLILHYNKSESEATPLAKSLADKVGDSLNITFYPLWSFGDEHRSAFLFTAQLNLSDTIEFMNNEIISKFPTEGLTSFAYSPIVQANMNEEVYTRAALTLFRDYDDIDEDNNTEEFVPILVLATMVPDAITEEDEWFKFSVKEALDLETTAVIEPNLTANYSILTVHSYLPLEVDENRSTIPDNPLYEFSGRFIYLLKAENFSRVFDNVLLYFKALNFTAESEIMPKMTSMFYISNIVATKHISKAYYGREPNAINVTFTVAITNFGDSGEALNVRVALPLVGDFRRVLNAMAFELEEKISEFISGVNWTIEYNTKIGDAYVDAFVTTVDRIGPKETVLLNFSVLLIPEIIGNRFGTLAVALSFWMGPIVTYEDIEGKDYFVIANGFVVSPRAALGTIARLIRTGVEPIDENDLLYRFNFNLTLAVFAGENPEIEIDRFFDIKAKLFLSKPTSIVSRLELNEVAEATLDELNITRGEDSETVHTFSLSFDRRLKAGVWAVFGYVEFTVETPEGNLTLGFTTNSYMIYIPPRPWIIQRWLLRREFPYPHVELNIEKLATYDNTTSELTISINITNEGDTDTKIRFYEFLLTDYINTSVGNNGVVSVKINGRAVDVYVEVKEDLGVLVIVSPWIPIKAGETIRVEITVKVVANYSGEMVIRPTLIEYNFGKFEPDRISDEESHMEDVDSREEMEHEGNKTNHEGGARLLVISNKVLRTMQEGGNALSTFTNLVILTITPPTGGGGEEEGGGGAHWGTLILLTLIAGVIVVVYVKISRRNKY